LRAEVETSHGYAPYHAPIPLFSRAANRAPIRMKASLRSNRRKIDYLAIGAMQHGRLLEGYLSGRNRACKGSVGKIAKWVGRDRRVLAVLVFVSPHIAGCLHAADDVLENHLPGIVATIGGMRGFAF